MKNKHNKNIYISGMTCTSCEVLISDSLQEIDSIKYVKINHREGIAKIDYGNDQLSWSEIISKIEDLGYEASLEPIIKPKNKTTRNNSQKSSKQIQYICTIKRPLCKPFFYILYFLYNLFFIHKIIKIGN